MATDRYGGDTIADDDGTSCDDNARGGDECWVVVVALGDNNITIITTTSVSPSHQQQHVH